MTTQNTFRKNFWAALKALAPFIALMVVGAAAAFSDASWGVFFLTSLPLAALAGLVLWLALSLAAGFAQAGNSEAVGGGGNASDSSYNGSGSRDINPSTGFPTVGGFGSQDVSGTNWGDSKF